VQAIAGDLPALAENVNRMLALVQDLPWDAHTAVIYYHLAAINYYQNNLAAWNRRWQSCCPGAITPSRPYLSIAPFSWQPPIRSNNAPPKPTPLTAFALDFCNETGHVQLAETVRAFAAELALRQGRPDDARFLALELADTPLLPTPFFYSPYMTLVKLYLCQNMAASLQMAFDLLERLEQFLASTHNVRFLMEALALKALAWQARGEQAAAVATLAQAIRLAEPGGYIRIFADLAGRSTACWRKWLRRVSRRCW